MGIGLYQDGVNIWCRWFLSVANLVNIHFSNRFIECLLSLVMINIKCKAQNTVLQSVYIKQGQTWKIDTCRTYCLIYIFIDIILPIVHDVFKNTRLATLMTKWHHILTPKIWHFDTNHFPKFSECEFVSIFRSIPECFIIYLNTQQRWFPHKNLDLWKVFLDICLLLVHC